MSIIVNCFALGVMCCRGLFAGPSFGVWHCVTFLRLKAELSCFLTAIHMGGDTWCIFGRCIVQASLLQSVQCIQRPARES